MFYDRFAQLCAQKGISPSGAAREIGIDKSNVSQWKARGLTPRADALHRIAAYFGITVDELLGLTSAPPPPPANAPAAEGEAADAPQQGAPLQLNSPALPYATHAQYPPMQNLYFRLAQEAQESKLSERDVEFILSFIRDHARRNGGE